MSAQPTAPVDLGSFDMTTGQVLRGPASDPLPAVPVRAGCGKLIGGPGAA